VKHWSILDSYYIPIRYPNGLPDGIPAEVFTEEAAFGAVELANQAVEFVRGLVNQ
jgi:HEPN domain-containing protein